MTSCFLHQTFFFTYVILSPADTERCCLVCVFDAWPSLSFAENDLSPIPGLVSTWEMQIMKYHRTRWARSRKFISTAVRVFITSQLDSSRCLISSFCDNSQLVCLLQLAAAFTGTWRRWCLSAGTHQQVCSPELQVGTTIHFLNVTSVCLFWRNSTFYL